MEASLITLGQYLSVGSSGGYPAKSTTQTSIEVSTSRERRGPSRL